VTLSIRAPGEIVASNHFTHSHVLGDVNAIELLSSLAEERTRSAVAEAFADTRFRIADATVSPFHEGLLGDPTGLDRAAGLPPETVGVDAALDLLLLRSIVVEDEAAYEASLAPRANLFDLGRRGSIHQQVGDYVLLGLREPSVDGWWLDQKFDEARRRPRAGLYRDVQWPFMESYYDEARLSGKRVLDFGCGPGLFARLFAARGADVLGVDVSAEHLATAARLAAEDGLSERCSFRELELPIERALERLAREAPFDLVFLSDILMFYFYPYGAEQLPSPGSLLAGLAGLLAPSGRIALLEPDGTFWRRPWLGAPTRPFTVVTEHRSARERVTPTLGELADAAEEAGLAITRMRELSPPEPGGGRGASFAHEFPIWWFFELQPSRR
jgi:SAM-dependent methyltransferase